MEENTTWPVNLVLIARHIYSYRPGFYLLNCSNVIFEDVTIHALPGRGVEATRCMDISLRRYRVFPSGKRIMSGNVDATHFISCSGTIKFEDCYFEGMGDDAVNVHSFYYTVGEKLDDRTVRVYITREYSPDKRYYDYPDSGDEVEFIRRETLYAYDQAVIQTAEFDTTKNETLLRFDRPLPEKFEMSDLIANVSKHARLKFANCTVRNIRSRGILVQTRDAVIENSIFDHCTGQGVHVDTSAGWMESIGTRNVIIRNNRFLSCGYGSTENCDAVGVVVETECSKPWPGIHRNIFIEGNLIDGFSRPGIYLSCVDGAVIRENRIRGCDPALRIEYARIVDYADNDFGGYGVVIGQGMRDKTSRFDQQ